MSKMWNVGALLRFGPFQDQNISESVKELEPKKSNLGDSGAVETLRDKNELDFRYENISEFVETLELERTGSKNSRAVEPQMQMPQQTRMVPESPRGTKDIQVLSDDSDGSASVLLEKNEEPDSSKGKRKAGRLPQQTRMVPESPRSTKDIQVLYEDSDGNASGLPEKKEERESSKRKRKAGQRRPKMVSRIQAEELSKDDGYKWKTIGRKFTKQNPNPRIYSHCREGDCPARKWVQKSTADETVYLRHQKYEHNHAPCKVKKLSSDLLL